LRNVVIKRHALTFSIGPEVTSAVFAPDGGRILTASLDGTARLWDRDVKPLATLQGHTGGVTSAVFAPDGGRILTASLDGTARLWNHDGKPLAALQGHTQAVNSAVFSPDGGRILTASGDTTARLWDREPVERGFAPVPNVCDDRDRIGAAMRARSAAGIARSFHARRLLPSISRLG
jgi:WD40 repeat protein